MLRPSGFSRLPAKQPHTTQFPSSIVIHYRWHPLFGESLQIRRSHRMPDGTRVYVCMLPDGTLSAIPAWMSDRERCLGCALSSTPEVSLEALEELRTLLATLPHLVTPITIRTRRTPVRREVRKDGEAKGGYPTRIESETTHGVARASRSKQGTGHRAAHATVTDGSTDQTERSGDE